jgi:hypothetical protein
MLSWRRIVPAALLPFTCAFTPFDERTFYFEPDSAALPVIADTAVYMLPDSTKQRFSEEADTLSDSASPALDDTCHALAPRPLTHDLDSSALPPAPADTATPVYDLPAMVVRPPSRRRHEAPYAVSSRSISPADIKQKAGAVADISRYIGTLPSAVSALGAGYDNTLFIRGGRPDEVIFMVDGIEMENINHFSKANGSGGPIGFINSDNVKSLCFYSGAMPVAFPSRMSSVVDIDMKNGSLYESRLALGCKLTGGMLSAEGPVVNGKSSYALSGRYVDFTALRSYVKDAGIPKAGDLFGRFFIIGNDEFDCSATGLLSWNRYRYFYPYVQTGDDGEAHGNEKNEIERIVQGGSGVTLRYTNGATTHEARLAVSFRDGIKADSLSSLADPFFADRYAANPVESERDSRVRYHLNTVSSFPIHDRHTLSLGLRAGVNYYRFGERNESNYEGECIVCRENGPDTVVIRQEPLHKTTAFYGLEPGAFLDYKVSGTLLAFTAGLRADYYDLLDDIAISPRVSLSVNPHGIGAFAVGMGLYHQFPTEMPSLTFANLPFNVPADSAAAKERELLRQARPQRCWQSSLGYNKFVWRDNELRIETYYKWYDREYDFVSPDILRNFERDEHGNLSLRKQDGKRRAFGIESSLDNRDAHYLFYSIGGSLFDIKNRYDDGSWQNDWTDVGYTYSFSLGTRFLGSHSISLSLQGSGGRPFCPKTVVADCINRKFAVYDGETTWFSRHLERLLTTNMRYAFTRRGSKVRTEGFIEVLNVLDYTPTLEYKWSGNRFVEVKPFKITPIVGATVNW